MFVLMSVLFKCIVFQAYIPNESILLWNAAMREPYWLSGSPPPCVTSAYWQTNVIYWFIQFIDSHSVFTVNNSSRQCQFLYLPHWFLSPFPIVAHVDKCRLYRLLSPWFWSQWPTKFVRSFTTDATAVAQSKQSLSH